MSDDASRDDDPAPAVMWFRRDLRLRDNPALLEACAEAGPLGVLPLFVVDPALWEPAGLSRRAYLAASLRELDESLGGNLVVRRGDPAEVVPSVVRGLGARTVHVAADRNPYGGRRDATVERALAERLPRPVELRRTGSPYAVTPGRVKNKSGDTFQVFTPFSRAWADHGWRAPAGRPGSRQTWLTQQGDGVPVAEVPDGVELPPAGEKAAHRRWKAFLDGTVADYDADRDKPGVEGTSRMSVHLKWGEIHPRTMLADLAEHASSRGKGVSSYRSELAWREFYADVLAHSPSSAREYHRPQLAGLDYARPTRQEFDAWKEGRTGYPIVDAGMRQLVATGWMHNRVRMITASFLVKDLHIEWQHGARFFMQHLVDGDLASNNMGWQWVAGSGTDAQPFFRIFNPTTQGEKFDPDGVYIKRWVPELRELEGKAVHRPHERDGGPPEGYPLPVVDHAEERRAALAAYEAVR